MTLQATSPAYSDTAHLLRRAGFGATPSDIQAAVDQGLPATTRTLLDYETVPDQIDDDAVIEKLKDALPEAVRDFADVRLPTRLLQIWWMYRMCATQRPLQEKMVLFWHNHFTSKGQGQDGDLMLSQNQLFRRNALGNFRTLVLDVSKDPEMLRYLNGAQNFKAHPNENYARELMELFTCGRVGPDGKPNYTEDDVKNSAKAFSGWNERAQDFSFNPNQHDDTAKTFMGHTGDLDGDDIVDILVGMPATGYYICHKLFRYFAYDDPEPEVMASLVDTYFNSGYEIKPVVEQILTSKAFFSDKARGAVIKQPADFVVGSVKMLGLAPSCAPEPEYLFSDAPGQTVPNLPNQPRFRAYLNQNRRGYAGTPIGRLGLMATACRSMGQDLFAPPTVKGWDGGPMWINTDTMQARARFGYAVSSLPDLNLSSLDSLDNTSLRTASFTGGAVTADQAQQMVTAAAIQLGPLQLPAPTQQALVAYGVQETSPDQCMRGILSLMMATPEYQVS
jgi:uncharacterized protein (DUF1800 family)